MRRALAILLTGLFALPLPAQQTQQQPVQKWECRDMSGSGNFLAPNETVISGMACRPAGAQSQVVDPMHPSNRPAPVTPAAALSTQQNPVTTQTNATTPAAPPASANAPVLSVSAPEVALNETGMYLEMSGKLTKILGQIVDFERTGSLLASKVTFGVKSAKGNAQLLGAHAQTVTGPGPEFYFIPAKQEADAGVNGGDLILIRLEEKKDRRQFEISAQGDWRASKGISLTHQVQLNRSEVRPGVFKIVPAIELGRGEYGLYLARGEGLAPYIYDFSVQ